MGYIDHYDVIYAPPLPDLTGMERYTAGIAVSDKESLSECILTDEKTYPLSQRASKKVVLPSKRIGSRIEKELLRLAKKHGWKKVLLVVPFDLRESTTALAILAKLQAYGFEASIA